MKSSAESMNLTVMEIEDRLEEAALTLKRSPNPPGSGPKGYGSSWPEYVRDWRHAYGYHDVRMKVIPNAREIQRMEEAIQWLLLIEDPDENRAAMDRRIVWMRADLYRWRQVCHAVGCSRATANRRWAAALITIQRKLAAPAKTSRNREGGQRRGPGQTGKGSALNAEGVQLDLRP